MTIDEVYTALDTLLRAVSVAAPAGTYLLGNKALVIPCFSLEGPQDQWGAQLISHNDDDRIHAWFFSQTNSILPEQRDRGGQLYDFWVISIYGYLAKREGTHTDNGDRDFNREANAITRALNADPTQLAEVLRSMRPFTLRRDVTQLGQAGVHFAVGDLIIKSC